jgi:hypothetical protein
MMCQRLGFLVAISLVCVSPLYAQDDTSKPDSTFGNGLAFTFMAGIGQTVSAGQSYNFSRLALQLSGTKYGARPVETTADVYLVTASNRSGAGLGISGGGNVMLPNRAYFGPVLGAILSGRPNLTAGVRAGLRPQKGGFRPEARGDVLFGGANLTYIFGITIGLEAR